MCEVRFPDGVKSEKKEDLTPQEEIFSCLSLGGHVPKGSKAGEYECAELTIFTESLVLLA